MELYEDGFFAENELSKSNLVKLNGKRKRDIENYTNKKSENETGRGKRIKKPISKFSYLQHDLEENKCLINTISRRRTYPKVQKRNINNLSSRQPLTPNGVHPTHTTRLVKEFEDNLSQTSLSLPTKINGKVYQELMVTDEDGKEEEIYVVDVTSDEESDSNSNEKLTNNNTKEDVTKMGQNNTLESLTLSNGSLMEDTSSRLSFCNSENKLKRINSFESSIHSEDTPFKNGYNINSSKNVKDENSINESFLNNLLLSNNHTPNKTLITNELPEIISPLKINTNSFEISKSTEQSIHNVSNKNLSKPKRTKQTRVKKEGILPKKNKSAKLNKKQTNKQAGKDRSIDFNGPHIKVTKMKKNSQTYKIINSKTTDTDAFLSNGCGLYINELTSTLAASKMTETIPWRCILCTHPSSYSILGDLYGPYYSNSVPQCETAKNQQKRRTFTSHEAATDNVDSAWAEANSLPSEIWVHADCAIWTDGVCVSGGMLSGLIEAASNALNLKCSYCDKRGSTLGCYIKGCSNKYHYLCALQNDCLFDDESYSIYCSKHKTRKNVSSI